MRYMGAVAGLTAQEQAAVAGFQQAYPTLGPDAQAAMYDVARASGGGADAHLRERAIFGGAGVALGLLLGVLLGRR
jgi:hypothetical protein